MTDENGTVNDAESVAENVAAYTAAECLLRRTLLPLPPPKPLEGVCAPNPSQEARASCEAHRRESAETEELARGGT